MAQKTAKILNKKDGSYVSRHPLFIDGYNHQTTRTVNYYQFDLDNGESPSVGRNDYFRFEVGDIYTYRSSHLIDILIYLVLAGVAVAAVVMLLYVIFN